VTTTSTDVLRANAGDAAIDAASAARPQMKTPRLRLQIVAGGWKTLELV
jgi:hypothetical protein